MTSDPDKKDDELGTVGKVIASVVVVVVFYLLVAGCAAWIAGAESQERTFTARDVYQLAWDIDESKEMPLVLGGSIVGSVGKTDFTLRSGLLSSSARGSGTVQPSSAVKISLAHEGRHFILEIPYSMVQFHDTAATPEEASVRFVVSDEEVGTASSRITRGSFWTFNLATVVHDPDVRDIEAWPEIEELGLGAFLLEHSVTVHVTLTPQQYAAYLDAEFPEN